MRILAIGTNENALQGVPLTAHFVSAGYQASGLSELRESLRQQIESNHIDIVVLDSDGIERSVLALIQYLSSRCGEVHILLYSSRTSYNFVASTLKAGASGYIVKDCAIFDLAQALRCIENGGVPLSPIVSRLLLSEFANRSLARSLSILTDREKQIFECIEEGNSYKGIGLKLNISQNTVHTHVKNIYSKLQAVDKYDALAKARELCAA